MIFNFMLPDEVIQECLLHKVNDKEKQYRIYNGIFLAGLKHSFPHSAELDEFLRQPVTISLLKETAETILEITLSGIGDQIAKLLGGLNEE